ncbi:MAG: T9SS type A sorting domain-containing protein [Flavobacteriales bacterium]
MPRIIFLPALLFTMASHAQLQQACIKMDSPFFINSALGGFVQTADGGYASVGTFSETNDGNSDIGITKFDANGNVQWMHQLNATGSVGAYAYAAVPTADGGLAIAGPHYLLGGVFIAKLDADGIVEWANTYTSPDYTVQPNIYFDSFVQMNDGGFAYLLTQSTISRGYCVLRTDANGEILWSDEVRFTYFASDLAELPNGDLILSGWESQGAALTMRKDGLTGATEWMHWFKGENENFGVNGVTIGPDSTIVLVGECAVPVLGERLHLCAMGLSPDGTPLWMTKVSTADHGGGWEVATHPDGGYVIAGRSFDFSTLAEIAPTVTRLTNDGQLEWSKRYTPTGLLTSWMTRISVADDGDLLVSGYDADDTDYPQLLRKLGPDGSSCPYCPSQDTGSYVALTPIIAPEQGFMSAGPWAISQPTPFTLTDHTAQVVADICGTTAVEEYPEPVLATVAPNPCEDRCTITLSSALAQRPVVIELRDALGRIVHRQRATGQANTIDIASLPAASYSYRIVEGNTTLATGKLHVMRP